MVKKKGMRAFTLIELIAVLVIMAILALIVTPLVMNIIRKTRIAADKRSVDAYGRSIELAIAGYLLDNGKFPTDVNQLSIEYSGDEVVCSTTQLNDDSSVYLTGCTVKGRTVDYTYGTDKTPQEPIVQTYSVGDHVSYNGITYYVIEDSDTSNDTVKFLKETPLTIAEVNQYGGAGTEFNHVNVDTTLSRGTAENVNGYGGIAYYSRSDCKAMYAASGCEKNYDSSDIKYIVDAWAEDACNEDDKVVARLLRDNEVNSFEIEEAEFQYYPCDGCDLVINKYNRLKNNWLYNDDYSYYIEAQQNSCKQCSSDISTSGTVSHDTYLYDTNKVVRPVIELNKSADITKLVS